VEIVTEGGTLEGWLLENRAATNELVILYFGGNAEDVLRTAETMPKLNARRMLVTNYRGYGASTGKPGQRALYEDGLAIYEYALNSGMQAHQIVLVGRSLGSGVASMLAGKRDVRAVVLITPYDSISAVATHHAPKLAVRLFLPNAFPSIEWAPKAHAPALMLAAENDAIIPAAHARRLSEAWAGEAQFHLLANTGHGDIHHHPEYYPLINTFLEKQLTPAR
jgi:uncharacterized protein